MAVIIYRSSIKVISKIQLIVRGECCRRLVVWLVFLGLSSMAAYAQSGRQPAPPDPPGSVDTGDVVKVRSDEIMITISVRDSDGKRVEDLAPTDFMIFDNGKRQEIAGFNRERTPVNVLLLLDASGSVFSHMRFIREAAGKFVRELRAVDNICVMQFADDVELLQDWTSAANTAAVTKALNWRYHPGESTSFYDGIYLAAKDRMSKVTGRKLIILLTDGIDAPKVKHASRDDSVHALKLSEAALYVISLTAVLRNNVDKSTGTTKKAQVLRGHDPRQVAQIQQVINQAEDSLNAMADATGGRMYLPLKDDDLKDSLEAISEELRSQYIITYRPNPAVKTDEWREIKVLVRTGGYDVQAREGYRGRSD
jgi:VWFA-related protein